MTPEQAVDHLERFCDFSNPSDISEAWQTLKTVVLGTTPNTGSPKLPCFTDWSVFAASQGLSQVQAHESYAWIFEEAFQDIKEQFRPL
jgi:hypothetical protein